MFNKNVGMICLDMDNTLADLYGVTNWLIQLRRFSPLPYRQANPMWDMEELANLLRMAQAQGVEIRIITWLSKDSNPEYDREVRQAKKDWLAFYGVPYDHFHGVAYGTTKANCIRKYLPEGKTAILVDDNEKVRKGWHMGDTIDPTACDLLETLRNLVGEG
jgi:hypothetical protein